MKPKYGSRLCASCKNAHFEIVINPYSKDVIPKKHYELVCTQCRLGIAITYEELEIRIFGVKK